MTGERPATQPSPQAPPLRASDAEREHAATQLREHCAAGRLTPDELAERLDAAYGARTVAELDALLADLPRIPLAHEPVAGSAPSAPSPSTREISPARARAREIGRRRVVAVAGQAVILTFICVVIWAATDGSPSFWPRWVALAMLIRLVLVAWNELGPGADDPRRHEARHGRGGARPPELRRDHSRDR